MGNGTKLEVRERGAEEERQDLAFWNVPKGTWMGQALASVMKDRSPRGGGPADLP